MTPQEYNKILSVYDQVLDKASKNLNDLIKDHRNEFGLTSDEIKATPEYKRLKAEYNQAHSMVRSLGASVSNKVKRDAAVLRRNRMLVN